MKCLWSWKLLKQLFIILLISFFGFWVSSFVSAATDTRRIILDNNNINENQVWTNPVTANWNNGYIITSKWNWNWSITDDWTFNNIWKIANTNRNHQRTYYFWNTWNEIVFSAWNSDWQTNWYNAIKPLKMFKTTPSQFTWLLINPYNEQFTYNISDFYNLTWNFTQLAIGVNVDWTDVYDSNWRYMCITIDNTDTYCTACQKQTISNCLWWNEDYLPSSQIYNYSYSDYEQYIWTSPFLWWGWSWWGWSTWVIVDNNLTWDYVYSNCTYKQLFDYLENHWYNDYLCYWWLDNFDLWDPNITYNPIPLSGKTLWQILTHANGRDTPNDWFIFRNWLYKERFTWPWSGWSDMWSSYPAVNRTWFDFYYRYWWEFLVFDAVREYCLLKQWDFDFNTTKYKWTYFKVACENIKLWQDWSNDYDYTWDTSNNVIWVNWAWIGNLSWTDVSNDPVVFIQDIFNKLKANMPTTYDMWLWMLPRYIITFMLALIIFRFIRH